MGTPLHSNLFTAEGIDASTKRKLQDCADGGNESLTHIAHGARGEHVRRVQEALQRLRARDPSLGIDPKTGKPVPLVVNGVYDPAFARAVAVYKARRNIRNIRDQIDDIVGKKTIRQIDEDLSNGAAPPAPVIVKVQDVVIHILGFDPRDSRAGTLNKSGEVGGEEREIGVPTVRELKALTNNDRYRALHLDLVAEHWFGGGGAANPGSDPTDKIVNSIKGHLAGKTLGLVMIVGYSIGGRNAVTVGRKLNLENIPIAFFGIADAAFNNPQDPVLSGSVQCGLGMSFFQSTTNSSLNHPMFEFHGPIAGLRNRDFDGSGEYAKEKAIDNLREPGLRNGRPFFNKLHKMAVKDGLAAIEPTLQRLLQGDLNRPR